MDEPKIVPTVGRMVYYKLSQQNAESINKCLYDAQQNMEKIRADSLGYQVHVGNEAKEGQVLPMTIVAVWSDTCINGKVFLDGNDDLWVTSVVLGEDNGQWDWMPYQKGQAKKTEELEEKLEDKE